MISVLIADDHALVRNGLTQMLAAASITVTCAVADGLEAVGAVHEARPDVVVMDLRMPRMDGVEAAARIVGSYPFLPVVILSGFCDQDRITEAFSAGATGYLLKDDDPADIVRGIRSAAAGQSPVAPRVARLLLTSLRERTEDTQLSLRERQVLDLVAEGSTNREIGARLGISEKTVKAHLTSAFHRTGSLDRRQAVAWMRRHRPSPPAVTMSVAAQEDVAIDRLPLDRSRSLESVGR